MKKALLIIFMISLYAWSSAQVVSSKIGMGVVNAPFQINQNQTINNTPLLPGNTKGTITGLVSRWYNYAATMSLQNGGLSDLNSTYLFPDTQITAQFGTTYSTPWVHSAAVVLDPKDSAFMSNSGLNIDVNTAYTLDSIGISCLYTRNPTSTAVDTLIVEFLAESNSNMPNYYFTGTFPQTTYGVDTLFFKGLQYTNSFLNASTTITVKYPLTAASAIDTLASGINYFKVGPPAPIAVAAGNVVAITYQFKPGFTYSQTDTLNNKNYFNLLSYEENGSNTYPFYTKSSFNQSFIMPSWARFDPSSSWHGLYVPSVAFVQAYGFENHLIDFKVSAMQTIVIPDLVITEINYNGPEGGSDSTEFIEIYNNDTANVNLDGYHFTQGFNYTFPAITLNAGDYIVLAKDSLIFTNLFGVTAYQWSSGSLSNGGEDIILVTDDGNTVDVVDYDDSSPWPTSDVDGGGHSMSFCDLTLDNNLGASWSATTNYVGVNSAGDSIWASPGMGCASVNPSQSFKILVVDDDANGSDESGKIVTALSNSGHPYSSFNISTSFPVFDTLIKYDMVIWTTANDGVNLYLWDVSDTAANGLGAVKFNAPLMQYLDSNGIVWVDGLDYMYDVYGSAPDTFAMGDFVYDAMGISVYAAQSHVDEPAGLSMAIKSATNTITNLDTIEWKWSTLWNGDAFDITSDAVSLYEMGPSTYAFAGKTNALYRGNVISSSLRIASFGDAGGNYIQADVDTLINDMINAAIAGTFAPIPTPGGDTTAPVVNSAELINGTTVLVAFSEVVDNGSQDVSNYTGIGTITSAVLNVSGDTVTLTLASAVADGVANTLTIANVMDVAGNAMASAQSFTFVYNTISTKLLITEIMYNDLSSSDSLEYFEMFNKSGVAINIGGFVLTEGVHYTFPANTMLGSGSYLVVAKDSALVNSVFGITGTHQWTSGGLKNSGEDIEIQNSVGDTIAYVDYDDASPWPLAGDGDGPSIEYCDLSMSAMDHNNDGSFWSASTYFVAMFDGDSIFGTPGSGCIIISVENPQGNADNISMYPNPVSNVLYFGNVYYSYEVSIFDITGSQVKRFNINDSDASVNLESLQAGLYFIQFVDRKTMNKTVKKLIVQ